TAPAASAARRTNGVTIAVISIAMTNAATTLVMTASRVQRLASARFAFSSLWVPMVQNLRGTVARGCSSCRPGELPANQGIDRLAPGLAAGTRGAHPEGAWPGPALQRSELRDGFHARD